MDTSQLVTKQDLNHELKLFRTDIEATLEKHYQRTEKMVYRVVGEVVGEIVGDALKLINERFNKVEARLDSVQESLDRVEDKLDRTTAVVDVHAVDIRTLKRKTA